MPLLSDRELFEAVYRRMRALAGSGAPDLDDLVQVAAEQVFKNLGSFEGRSELLTWVYSICYRVLLKQRRWYRRFSLRFRLERDGDPMPVQHALQGEQLEQLERARRLQAALAKLSDKLRAVVVLHDLEELGIREVAALVACGELTVRSRLRDGRAKLRALLEADESFVRGGKHVTSSS